MQWIAVSSGHAASSGHGYTSQIARGQHQTSLGHVSDFFFFPQHEPAASLTEPLVSLAGSRNSSLLFCSILYAHLGEPRLLASLVAFCRRKHCCGAAPPAQPPGSRRARGMLLVLLMLLISTPLPGRIQLCTALQTEAELQDKADNGSEMSELTPRLRSHHPSKQSLPCPVGSQQFFIPLLCCKPFLAWEDGSTVRSCSG